MPDISMCKGNGSELCETCYRSRVEPAPEWQAYFEAPPIEAGECEYYWPIEELKDD